MHLRVPRFDVQSQDDKRKAIAKMAVQIDMPSAPEQVLSIRSKPANKLSSAKYTIGGMTCASCTGAIETVLSKHQDIYEVSISLLSGNAAVKYDEAKVTADGIRNLIEDCGFDAALVIDDDSTTSYLLVDGMTCASCVNAVEQTLRNVPGVRPLLERSIATLMNTFS